MGGRDERTEADVTATVDRVDMTYLGYPLEITNRDVTVRDQQGRKLVTVTSIRAARNFVKGYRRGPSLVKAEPANVPAKVLAGSDKRSLDA